MKWRIQHRTRYIYGAPARDSFNDVRLKPAANEHQALEFFSIVTTPTAPFREYHDYSGNCVHHFEIAAPHHSLLIESTAVVVTNPPEPLAWGATLGPLADIEETVKMTNCFDFLGSSRFVEVEPDIWRLAIDATAGIADVWHAVLALMNFTHGHLAYRPASTHVHTPMREVLAKRCGVCQDFAHVMLGLCRAVKIPAQYVSGYLATEQARATHAWIEVMLPKVGWLALDPTHNCQADDTYIKIATGRDYSDVPPVMGHYKGSLQRRMEVEVNIESIND